MFIIVNLIIILLIHKSQYGSKFIWGGLIALASLFLVNSDFYKYDILFIIIYFVINFIISVLCIKIVNKLEFDGIQRIVIFSIAYNILIIFVRMILKF